jgi:hypothetical protein
LGSNAPTVTSLSCLVPTFGSSCCTPAATFTNFGKSWELTNLLIPVPLYRSEVPERIRRLRCRDFRSAVLAQQRPGLLPIRRGGFRHNVGEIVNQNKRILAFRGLHRLYTDRLDA